MDKKFKFKATVTMIHKDKDGNIIKSYKLRNKNVKINNCIS